MQKKNILAIAALFACFAAAANAAPAGFITGDLTIQLDKQEYNAGETFNAKIRAFNGEQTPLAEAFLVVEIAQGKEQYYPSQDSDADNVFFEQKISGINLRPAESKEIVFSFTLPGNLAAGDYRIDVYFKNKISNIVGMPNIFGGARSARFTVKGNGNWPNLKILRTKTIFEETAGPIGPPVEPGATVKGKVFIKNNSAQKATGKKLLVKVCEWDDTACLQTDFLKPEEKTIEVGAIEANSEKEIEVELIAPKQPNAYSIRLELLDGNKTESLYRSRIIVVGATATVRKISLNNYDFKENDKVNITLLLGPSPDHYNYPVLKDFEAKITVQELDKNTIVFASSEAIGEISKSFIEKTFSFAAKKDLNHFLACATVEKAGATLDKQCFEFDANKFSKPPAEPKITVSWKYDQTKKMLSIDFCNEPKEIPLNGEYFMVEMEKTSTVPIIKGTLQGSDCVRETMPTGPANFEINLLDYNSKRPSKVFITLKEMEKTDYLSKTCSELKGKQCAASEQCTSAAQKTKDIENCCLANCTKAVSIEPGKIQLDGWMLVAVAIMAVLLIFGYWVKKNEQN